MSVEGSLSQPLGTNEPMDETRELPTIGTAAEDVRAMRSSEEPALVVALPLFDVESVAGPADDAIAPILRPAVGTVRRVHHPSLGRAKAPDVVKARIRELGDELREHLVDEEVHDLRRRAAERSRRRLTGIDAELRAEERHRRSVLSLVR